MTPSVVIPTLNEEKHIGQLLLQLASGSGFRPVEIIVADGGSTDRTKEIVESMAISFPRIRLIYNARKIQAAGINQAVSLADSSSDVIIRMDAHAAYPDDYVECLMREIEARDCDTVVVALRTIGGSCFQSAVSKVCNSTSGTGGASHRLAGREGYVDHGHHAAFKRKAFESVGGYDPNFLANEDAEFDARLRRAGGRIWLTREVVVDYVPRDTLSGLARQYFRYGSGRAQNFQKNGGLKLRQIVPPVFVFLLTMSLFASWWSAWFLAFPAAYASAIFFSVANLFFRDPCICTLWAITILPTIHLSWAAGFWFRLLTSKS